MKTSRIWFCSFLIEIKLDKTKKVSYNLLKHDLVNYNLLFLERINMFIGRKKELDTMEKCYRQDKFECVVIYGRRRVGKTTLINLLMRFYDLNSGKILIDQKDITDVNRTSLRKSFGMVLQDTWIKKGTIRENIKLGKPEATDEDVIQAAKSAMAYNFIKRLPEGFETIVENNDSILSEGERQLISIARVMLLDPPMLILDEATSNIDTRTEQKVQKAFAKLMKGRTSFVVAHRLSTIVSADIILVMKNGEIIEKGKHQELLESGGFYAKLYNSQYKIC